ncbi:MAG: PBP1A family penicillin-binding protein [Desulfatiglandaceae bacterium]
MDKVHKECITVMKRVLKAAIWGFSILILLGIGVGGYFWYLWSSNLPYVGEVREYRPPVITRVFSERGEVIGRFWEEKRTVVSLDRIPDHLVQAFVAAEDSRFFDHEGVDFRSIFRAFIKNLTAGRIEQGGSTITQQVTKSLLLKNVEKTYRRKVREAILAVQLDKMFSKDHILFLYLNQIYLGQGAYGVAAAAGTYFNKEVQDLNLAESALLAGLPQSPAKYSPVSHFGRARFRQKYVLKRMAEEGYIDDQAYAKALNTPLEIETSEKNTFEKAPYFTEHVRRYLLKKYGRDLLYRGGLQVHTTLDLHKQTMARAALAKGLAELDKREGYRGPVKHVEGQALVDFQKEAAEKWKADPPTPGRVVQGVVMGVDDKQKTVWVQLGAHMGRLSLQAMNWARKPNHKVPSYAAKVKAPSAVLEKGDVIQVRILKPYDGDSVPPHAEEKGAGADRTRVLWDVALEQTPVVQGAIVCMEPDTGEVKAMVGGQDFDKSQFNRVIQSRRQPGSAFKPIIYAAALDQGMNAADIILDSPFISDRKPGGEAWKPKNYKEKFYGPTLLRTGLVKSRNVITVKILRRIGIDYAIDYARNLGITSELVPDLSLALGSSGVSLMELTRAYSVFGNGGMLVEPIFVQKVVDRSGQVVEEKQPSTQRVISPETAFVMTDLMKAVIQEGTGWRIKALRRPAAGKTGTTNNLRDAWFMGYVPGLATGVWVGYDEPREMGKGETGSRAASPIWLYFMSEVLEGMPVLDFQVPQGVVFAKIDAKSGLLAGSHSQKTVLQSFIKGTEPKKYARKPSAPEAGEFSQFDMDSY